MDVATVDSPRFLVVGTPRSGTTLMQRLISELPGVRVTPETHFWRFYRDRLAAAAFPLSPEETARALDLYLGWPLVHDIAIDRDQFLAHFRDGCPSALHFFSALVRGLAPGYSVIGEKTPKHLEYWKPLHKARPDLQFIVVRRDPRAVIASLRPMRFGMTNVAALAAEWSEDVREGDRLLSAVGQDRGMLVRYEDAVEHPGSVQRRVAAFLGVERTEEAPPRLTQQDLFFADEIEFKKRALEPVDPSRQWAWRSTLSTSEVRTIECMAARPMRQNGYEFTGSPMTRLQGLTPANVFRAGRYLRARRRRRDAVERLEARLVLDPGLSTARGSSTRSG